MLRDQYDQLNPSNETARRAVSNDSGLVLGVLERVSARAGWPHEAHEFTPWLAENVGLLGEALGLALELQAREHKVGRYSLDLLLSDSAERTVIVENQFGQTDHDHLGKLLTYCAGTEADVVIWIAERLNEEHVAVLDWLNENTRAGVGFFGVELELLRIDSSPLAPNFRVVSQPNDWAKRVRPASAALSVDWDWTKYRDDLRISDERLAVGRAIVERLESQIAGDDVPWTIQFRKGYLAMLRPGGYRVAIVDLYWKNAPRFAVRLPDTPEALGLSSPYSLAMSWDAAENMWGWAVPSLADMPDVALALDLVKPFNPESGPMTTPGPPSGS
jgi:hypothetical protein